MTAPVQVGDLRQLMTLESPVRTGDGAGGASVSWEAVADIWAALFSRSASEAVAQDRIAGRATHDIWIRYRAGVTPEMRFRFGARVFEILGAIDIDNRRRWLKCPVEERDL